MYRNISYKINKEDNWQGKIHFFTWDKDGNPITQVYPHNSHLYFEDSRGKYESIFGTKLKKKEFKNVIERKKFIEKHPYLKYYHCLNPSREFLFNTFKDYENNDFDNFPLKVHFIDIEIRIEDEFPDPYEVKYPINLITIYDNSIEKYFTWALPEDKKKDYILDRKDCVLKTFKSEKDLLMDFLNWFEQNYPDIISGWNSMFFDIPYIINRLKKLLPFEVERISPVRNFYKTIKMQKSRKMQTYCIDGISHLDYLFLYRDKFTYEKKFSYTLNNVCEDELDGFKKIEYEGSIKNFYKKDFLKFIKYNIRDVELLKKLDNLRNLIYQARKMCNLGLVEYESIYSSIPYIYNAICIDEYKRTKRLYPSNVGIKNSDEVVGYGYEGAFVKKPMVGKFSRGVTSIDLNSLYPNICIALNLSPETYFGKITSKDGDNVIIKLNNGDSKIFNKKQLNYLLKTKCTLSSNKVLYYKHNIKKGSIPQFLERMYKQRKKIKKLTQKKERLINKLEEEQENNLIDHSNKIKNLKNEVKIEKMDDVVRKAYLNSVYGIIGSKFSAIYNLDNAEAITLTGQFIIKEASEFIEEYIKNNFNVEKDRKFICYNDTDSSYFDCQPFVDKIIGKDGKFTKKNINIICKELDTFVNDIINKYCYEVIVKKKLFSTLNTIEFKREVFATTALFLTKKRYILHKRNDEGMFVDKFKYVGVEMKKTEIPPKVRQILINFIEDSIRKNWNNSKIYKKLMEIWEIFKNLNAEEVAYYKGLNKEKQPEGFLKTPKGTQVHARASIYYNQLIEKLNIKNNYEEIRKSDRMRYLWIKKDNNYALDTIGFIEKYPKEFKNLFEIDYKVMFEKMILKPLKPILNVSNWDIPNMDKTLIVYDVANL